MMASTSKGDSSKMPMLFRDATCRLVQVDDTKVHASVSVRVTELLSGGGQQSSSAHRMQNTRTLVIADNSYSMESEMEEMNLGICEIYKMCKARNAGAFHLAYFNHSVEELRLPEEDGVDPVCNTIKSMKVAGGTDFDVVCDRIVKELDEATELATATPEQPHQLFVVVLTDGQASMPSDERFEAISAAVRKFSLASEAGYNEVSMYVAGIGASHSTGFLKRLQKTVSNENSFYLFAREQGESSLGESLRQELKALETSMDMLAGKGRARAHISLPNKEASFTVPLMEAPAEEKNSKKTNGMASQGEKRTVYYGEVVRVLKAGDGEAVKPLWKLLQKNASECTMELFGRTVSPVLFNFLCLAELQLTYGVEVRHAVMMLELNAWLDEVIADGNSSQRIKDRFAFVQTLNETLAKNAQAVFDGVEKGELPEDDGQHVSKLRAKEEKCFDLAKQIMDYGARLERVAELSKLIHSVEGPLIRVKPLKRLCIDHLEPKVDDDGKPISGSFQLPKLRSTRRSLVN